MLTSGRVVFTDMEEVHYGKPADRSVADLVTVAFVAGAVSRW